MLITIGLVLFSIIMCYSIVRSSDDKNWDKAVEDDYKGLVQFIKDK